MPDVTIKQGSTSPALTQTILDGSGNPLDLTGATVSLAIRALTAANATVNPATVSDALSGLVSYTFTTTDTAVPGIYTAEFIVTLSGGAVYTWPNDGYLEISVEPNLSTAGGAMIVSLGEAKDYLNFQNTDRTRDAKLLRFIKGLTPVVESITGPILPRIYDEWYDGGQHFIRLRHRPVIILVAVSEFRGPIEYVQQIVQDPAHGQIYSVQLDGSRVVRRTSGGGVVAFPQMPQSVHVVYQAGYLTVPDNVTDGVKELLRLHFQSTQQGRPRLGGTAGSGVDSEEPGRQILGFFVPNSVRERLVPNRKHSAVA